MIPSTEVIVSIVSSVDPYDFFGLQCYREKTIINSMASNGLLLVARNLIQVRLGHELRDRLVQEDKVVQVMFMRVQMKLIL